MKKHDKSPLYSWLVLSFTPKLGGVGLGKLLTKDSPCHLINYSADQLALLGLTSNQIRYIKQDVNEDVEACLSWGMREENHIITPQDSAYPRLMLQLSSHPPVLFVKGNVDLLNESQVAIVGSRNASLEGLKTAKAFAFELSKQGFCITSGLALGVDGYAHDGALNAKGKTIAVLGSGLEEVYPKKHLGLANRILRSGGALVSELRPNATPRAEFFPRRNRIISGLSLGTLVVEATKRSGSLITARYALEQNREVFALPGSIYSPNHQGSNDLIQQGAMLVQSVEDITQELQRLDMSVNKNRQSELFSEPKISVETRQKVKEKNSINPELASFFSNFPISVDILVERTHISVQDLIPKLLELELHGEIIAIQGGYIRCD